PGAAAPGVRRPASGVRRPASGVRRPASGVRRPASGVRRPASGQAPPGLSWRPPGLHRDAWAVAAAPAPPPETAYGRSGAATLPPPAPPGRAVPSQEPSDPHANPPAASPSGAVTLACRLSALPDDPYGSPYDRPGLPYNPSRS